MKKIYFFLSVGALALASCSNDDVVNPAISGNENAGEVPMGFSIYTPNMSRATIPAVGLQTVTYDFGVWAYKGGSYSTENPVMENYLVGYTDGTKGYVPNGAQNLYGSKWYYEGLGSTETKYTWGGSDIIQYASAAKTSAKEVQYLKYWDKGVTHTYFVACAPYGAGTWNATNSQLTIESVTGSTAAPAMYACAKYANASMTWTDASKTKASTVLLSFKRLGAMIRIAFYGDITGYDIDLIDYSSTNEGVICVPAKKNADNTYATGQYTNKSTNVITFAEGTDFAGTTATTYPSDAMTDANIVCPLWFRPLNAAHQWAGTSFTTRLGTTKDTAIYGGTTSVVAAQAAPKANDGFTVNVSLKLTAKDTGEILYVKGARVHVPAADCQWQNNKLYTYIFKVTNKVGGQPDDPTDPDPTPNDGYLVPIVYDNCVVEAMEEIEKEYNIN